MLNSATACLGSKTAIRTRKHLEGAEGVPERYADGRHVRVRSFASRKNSVDFSKVHKEKQSIDKFSTVR